jgi:hypothetical protein
MCRGLARLLVPESSEVCFRQSKLMAGGRQVIECDALVLVDGNIQLVIEARYVHQFAQAILGSSPNSRRGLSGTAEFNLEARRRLLLRGSGFPRNPGREPGRRAMSFSAIRPCWALCEWTQAGRRSLEAGFDRSAPRR